MKLRQLAASAAAVLLAMNLSSAVAQQARTVNGVVTQAQRIQFQSITPKNRFEFVRHTGDNKPITVYGDLFMPPNATGPVPAVVISHGSSGVGPAMYDVWARAFVSWGYAAFVVDSFKPRGIEDSSDDQGVLDPMANVADAFNALKTLASDTRIDPKRIAIIGFSRGGGVAIDTYFDMYRNGVIAKDSDLKFAANIPVYPNGCNVKYRADWANKNHSPMLFLLAEKDEVTPAKDCVSYLEDMNAKDGLNIQYKVYKGAYHGFDGHSKYHWESHSETARNCNLEVKLTDVPGGGLGEARDNITGKSIVGYDAWSKAYQSCKRNAGSGVGGDPTISAEAVADVHAFLGKALE